MSQLGPVIGNRIADAHKAALKPHLRERLALESGRSTPLGAISTGTHGDRRHMGNVTAKDRDDDGPLDVEAGANVTSLSDRFDADPYSSRTPVRQCLAAIRQVPGQVRIAARSTVDTSDRRYPSRAVARTAFGPTSRSPETRRV